MRHAYVKLTPHWNFTNDLRLHRITKCAVESTCRPALLTHPNHHFNFAILPSGIGRINEVTFGIFTKSPCRPTQPPIPNRAGNERPNGGVALQLESKGRHGAFHLWTHVWGWQVNLSDPTC